MRVDSLANQPDMAGRYRVCFSDGTVLRLYRQTVQDYGLYPGLELEEETFQKLQQDASQMSAKMRAVRIVASSNISQKGLERRLVQKGEDPQQAKNAVKWMSDMDLLDDRKTAEQIVSSCIRKGYGLTRAKQALYEKQIPREFWQEVLEDYPDQMEYIVSFLSTRLKGNSDEREIRRATDALIRRGHSYGAIRKGLGQLAIDDDFQEE